MGDENTIARCISILEEIGKNIDTISLQEAEEKMEKIKKKEDLEKTLQRKINELTNQPLSSAEAEEYIRLSRALVNASIRLTYNQEALAKLVDKTVYIRQKMAVILGRIVVNPELKKWHEEALDQLINLTRESYIDYLAPSKARRVLKYTYMHSVEEIIELIKKIEKNEKTFKEEITKNNWPDHISNFMEGRTFYETYEDAICLLAERDLEKFMKYSEEKFKEKKPVLCKRYFKGLERAVKNIMSLLKGGKLTPSKTTEKLKKIKRFLEKNVVSGAREGIWEYIDKQLINLFTAELRAASNVADIKKF